MPQKVTQVDEAGIVISSENPMDVGGDGFAILCELLHQILHELKLNNEILKGIAK